MTATSSFATTSARPSVPRRFLTTDHMTIGIGYFVLSLGAVLVGVLLSLLMRIHIVWPNAGIPFLGQIRRNLLLVS